MQLLGGEQALWRSGERLLITNLRIRRNAPSISTSIVLGQVASCCVEKQEHAAARRIGALLILAALLIFFVPKPPVPFEIVLVAFGLGLVVWAWETRECLLVVTSAGASIIVASC